MNRNEHIPHGVLKESQGKSVLYATEAYAMLLPELDTIVHENSFPRDIQKGLADQATMLPQEIEMLAQLHLSDLVKHEEDIGHVLSPDDRRAHMRYELVQVILMRFKEYLRGQVIVPNRRDVNPFDVDNFISAADRLLSSKE